MTGFSFTDGLAHEMIELFTAGIRAFLYESVNCFFSTRNQAVTQVFQLVVFLYVLFFSQGAGIENRPAIL